MSGTTYCKPVNGHNVVSSSAGAGAVINNNFNAPQTTWRPRSHIPLPRNEGIVCRPDLVAQLDDLLPATGGGHSAALYGLGGSGKTQLALEYAYRRSLDGRCSVFWVHAEDDTTFTNDYLAIGRALDMDLGNLHNDKLLEAVRHTIQREPEWLLVIDNADDLGLFGVGNPGQDTTTLMTKLSLDESSTQRRISASRSHASRMESAGRPLPMPSGPSRTTRKTVVKHGMIDEPNPSKKLQQYVPTGPGGTVVWTTRDKNILVNLVDRQRGIEVARMEEKEAEQLLTNAIGRGITNRDEVREISTLLKELQLLPLAIYQAASYMRETETSIHEYLGLLQEGEKRWAVLSEIHYDRHRVQRASNSVLATWDISIKHIESIDPLAYKVLHTIAYVDNQNIPLQLIEAAAAHEQDDGEDQKATGIDEGGVRKAIKRLVDFSFLTKRKTEEGDVSYEMHKLVQEGVRYRLKKMAESVAESRSQRRAAQPERKHESTTRFSRLRQKWHQAIPWTRNAANPSPSGSAGRKMHQRDEKYFAQTALSVIEKLFPRQPEYEDWKECEKYLSHAMRVADSVSICKENVRVGHLLQHVSFYLHGRQRWREKEGVDRTALALLQEAQGDLDPDVLYSLQDQASTFWGLGRYHDAEKLQKEVLKKWKEILGETHLATLGTMYNLATTYSRQGRYDDAEQLATQALQASTHTLGRLHQNTLDTQDLLAHIYTNQGRLDEAEDICLHLAEQFARQFGERHSKTLDTQAQLARIYRLQSRCDKAEKIQAQVLIHLIKLFGDFSTEAMDARGELAATYYHQSRYDEAESLQVQVLAYWQQFMGDLHPGTVIAKHVLAQTWNCQKKTVDAMAMMEEVVEQSMEILGADHPFTVDSRNALEVWRGSSISVDV